MTQPKTARFRTPIWPAFTPTKWATAEDKSKAATAIVKFVDAGFERRLFTARVYDALHVHMFGHIAHNDIDGFYRKWFGSLDRQVEWLRFIAEGGEYGLRPGDPSVLWCDVEEAVIDELDRRDFLVAAERKLAGAIEQAERAQLSALLAKYPMTSVSVGGGQR